MTKEQIYDEQINPLMAEIIRICHQNKIACLATSSIPNDEDDDLVCTTALLSEDFDPPEAFVHAYNRLRPREPMILTVKDGSGNVKKMHAIL
jgi:hypothetical protein